MLKRTIIFGVLSALLISIGYAAIYSDYQLGPRPSAMGGAYIAVADDVDAVYWNPAGLATLSKTEVAFQHSDVFDVGIYEEYFSVVHPLGKGIGLGFSWVHHDADLEEGFGQLRTNKTNQWADDLFIIGTGIKLKENLMLGLNIKRFLVKTDMTATGSAAGSGTGFDISCMYHSKAIFKELEMKNIKYAFVMRNVATNFNSEHPSIDYKLGASALFFEQLTLASDLVLIENDKDDKEFIFYAGADYRLNNNINIRIGLNDGSFTTGFGLTYLNRFKFNYSYQSKLSDVEEDNHKFSFAYVF